MSERQSLADSAVTTLAAVAAMDNDGTLGHDQRYQVRTLKRLAGQAIDEALRHAQELACLAESIKRDAKKTTEGQG